MLMLRNKDKLRIYSAEQAKFVAGIASLGLGTYIAAAAFIYSWRIDITFVIIVTMFIIAGLLLLHDVSYIYLELNRQAVSRYSQKSFGKSEGYTFQTSDISKVRKEECVGIGNGSNAPNDILQLQMKGKGLMELAATRQSRLYIKSWRPFRRQGKKIAEFLGVPFEIKEINLVKEFIKDQN